VLGEHHPDVATSLNNLASLYKSQGKYEQALPLYERSLAIWEKVLGEHHPNTAMSYWHLAVWHQNQANNIEAKQFYEKALNVFQQVYDENHPHLQNCRSHYENFLRDFEQDATDG
jgi:tetratricopeptide (TPR) repeat protein